MCVAGINKEPENVSAAVQSIAHDSSAIISSTSSGSTFTTPLSDFAPAAFALFQSPTCSFSCKLSFCSDLKHASLYIAFAPMADTND